MSKAEVATSLSGTKLKEVLDKTGISLHDLTIMQKNSSTDFKKLATSLDMTSTELGNLVNAGNDLENFSEIAGMTAEEFTKAWEEDAAGALIKFIQGLGDTSNASENAITMLSEMGITEVRLRDSLVRAANANELFTGAIKDSSTAWNENTALVTEANRRYETVESQLQMAKNELINVGIAIYDKFRAPLVKALDSARDSIKKFGKQMATPEMTESIEIIAEAVGKFVAGLVDLATKVIPKAISMLSKLIKNWDKLKPLIVGATTALLAYKVLNSKVIVGMTTGNALMKVGSTLWGVMTGKIKLATVAQKLFTAAQAATPWGLAALGIGAVVAGTIALIDAKNKVSKETEEEIEKIKEQEKALDALVEKQQEEIDAVKERNAAQEEVIGTGLGELNHYETLWEELKLITDENGKVKKSYEDRAKFIVNTLNEALGSEIELTNNQISNYQSLQEEIDKLIEKKKAMLILDAKEEDYKTAVQNESKVRKENATNKATYESLEAQKKKYEDELKKAQDDLETLYVKFEKAWGSRENWGAAEKTVAYYKGGKEALENLREAEKVFDEFTKKGGAYENSVTAYEQSQALLEEYARDIADYESTSAAILNKDYEKVVNAHLGLTKDWTDATKKELKNGVVEWVDYAATQTKLLGEAIEKGEEATAKIHETNLKAANEQLLGIADSLKGQVSKVSEMSTEVKEAWKTLATDSKGVYLYALQGLDEDLVKEIEKLTGVTATEGTKISDEWAKIANDSLIKFTGDNYEFMDAGNGMVQLVIDGVEVGEPQLLSTMQTLTNDAVSKLKNGEVGATEAGKQLLEGVNAGVSDTKKQNSILSKVGLFANNIVNKLKKAWDEHSPSKKSQQLAEYFMEGIAVGFDKKENPLLKRIRDFGNEVTTSLQGELNQNDLNSKVGDMRRVLNSTLQEKLGAISASVNGSVNLGINPNMSNGNAQVQSNGGKVVNIYQTNNSPKPLDRLEIWRQTHNAANLAARS